MKLHDYQAAPSPRRVRIFLAEKGIAVERVQVDLRAAENLKAPFLARNPRGLVPTLELDDGTCIDEVVAICRYFELQQPDPPLMGTDAKSCAVIESRNRHMEIDGLQPIADAFRNSVPGFSKRALQGVTEETAAIAELVPRGHAGVTRFHASLNAWLGEHAFVAGDAFSIADITAMVAIDFAGWIKRPAPADHVHLLRWYAQVAGRPSAKA